MMKRLFIGIFLYLLAIAAIWFDGTLSGYEKSQYAVVLGNQVLPTGEPSPRLQARLQKSLDLYRAGSVKQIIVSGGTGKEGFDEARVMKDWLQSQGIPESALIMDNDGYNTRKTAINAAQWIKPDKPVIVVSQLYHLSRTKLAFRQAGFQRVGAAYPLYFEWRDIYASLRAVPAWLKYWINGSLS